jgi:hypothetical protein
LLNGEIFYTLREAQIVHRELATPLQHDQAARIARIYANRLRSAVLVNKDHPAL